MSVTWLGLGKKNEAKGSGTPLSENPATCPVLFTKVPRLKLPPGNVPRSSAFFPFQSTASDNGKMNEGSVKPVWANPVTHPRSLIESPRLLKSSSSPPKSIKPAVPPAEGVRQKAIGVKTTVWREGIRKRGICIGGNFTSIIQQPCSVSAGRSITDGTTQRPQIHEFVAMPRVLFLPAHPHAAEQSATQETAAQQKTPSHLLLKEQSAS